MSFKEDALAAHGGQGKGRADWSERHDETFYTVYYLHSERRVSQRCLLPTVPVPHTKEDDAETKGAR